MSWSRNKLSAVLAGVGAVTLIAYPFAVYFGIQHFNVRILGVFLAGLFLIRFFALRFKKQSQAEDSASYSNASPLPKSMVFVPLMGACIALLSSLLNQEQLLLFYPVVMSLIMLLVFSSTLIYPPSLIERFARWSFKLKGQNSDLPPEAITYTRKVTIVWCAFFIFNACIATFTCLKGNLELWALYNGLVSYLLMGILFVGEFLFRHFVLKVHNKTSIVPNKKFNNEIISMEQNSK